MAKKPAKSKAKPAKKAAKPTKKAAKPAAKKAPKPAAKKATPKPKAGAAKKPAPKAPANAAPKAAKPASTTTITSASKAAGNAGATTNTGPRWRAELGDELAKLPDDFAAYCADRGAKVDHPWDHADTDHLKGLEAWGKELASRDRRLGIAALLGIAQTGFRLAMATAGDAAKMMGFHASEPHGDGAPVETQIARAAAWIADPTDDNLAAVEHGFDATRQLQAWDEDLIAGADDQPWFWYTEVGQCLACAIMRDDGDEDGNAYESWPPHTSVSRGMVMAVRGLRDGGDDAAALGAVRSGMVG